MKQVIKRNSDVEAFDAEKIIRSIERSFQEVDGDVTDAAYKKAKEIAKYIEDMEVNLSVDAIQNIVEEKLMNSSRKDVARAYVRYRYKKELSRKKGDETDKIFNLIEKGGK